MTQTEQITVVLDLEGRALTIVQLMARTGWEEWPVRNALARLRKAGIVTHGAGIVTGRMGRRRVRYALTPIGGPQRKAEAAA